MLKSSDSKVAVILHPFRACDHTNRGFMRCRLDALFRAQGSVGKGFAGLYDPNFVIGKDHVSVGELDLRHVTTHAVRLSGGAYLRVNLG